MTQKELRKKNGMVGQTKKFVVDAGLGTSIWDDKIKFVKKFDQQMCYVCNIAVNNGTTEEENYYDIIFGNHVTLPAVSGVHLVDFIKEKKSIQVLKFGQHVEIHNLIRSSIILSIPDAINLKDELDIALEKVYGNEKEE